MDKDILNLITLCFVVIILLIILFSFSYQPRTIEPQREGLGLPRISKQMRLADYFDVQDMTLYIGKGCKAIPMIISDTQAISIQSALVNKTGFRPVTHDLFVSLLENFEIILERAEIIKLEDNTYFARILFRKGNKILELDSRPSDSVALALRTNSPVYINETLLEEWAVEVC